MGSIVTILELAVEGIQNLPFFLTGVFEKIEYFKIALMKRRK